MGNRTEIVKKNIKGQTVDKEKYIYNESNQLQQANLFDGKKWTKVVYTYDEDGNLISEVGRDGNERVQTYYDYTVENRLEAVYDGKKLLMAAAYDGDGNRVFQLNYDPNAYDDWRYGYGCYKNYWNGCDWDDWDDKEWNDSRNGGDWGDDSRNDRDWGDGGKNNSDDRGNSGKKNGSVTGSLRCTSNSIHNSAISARKDETDNNRSEKLDAGCDEYSYNSQGQYCMFFPADKGDDKDKHKAENWLNKAWYNYHSNDYELIEYINDVNREYVEVLVEQNFCGKADTSYIYGVDRLSYDNYWGLSSYYLYDGRGSVTGLTDEKGWIYQSYRYSVTGEITFGEPRHNNEYTYNGESYNPNIESQYLRARYYNVVTATFLTEDSYLGNITNPLTLNRYNYTLSNYLNYQDPSGHDALGDIAKSIMNSVMKWFGKNKTGTAVKHVLPQVGTAEVVNPNLIKIYDDIKRLNEVGVEEDVENYILDCDKKYPYLTDVVKEIWLVNDNTNCYEEDDGRREVYIPEVVTGVFNGEELTLYPKEKWGIVGGGNYEEGVQKDSQGRYIVAVGPKVLIPDYPDSGNIYVEDFEDVSRYLEVTIQHRDSGEIKVIECYAKDIKAHSFNEYPAGQAYQTGDEAIFYVESGLIQTGIAYPNSWNAEQSLASSRGHADGSVIEFAGNALDFIPYEYTLESIVVLEDMEE